MGWLIASIASSIGMTAVSFIITDAMNNKAWDKQVAYSEEQYKRSMNDSLATQDTYYKKSIADIGVTNAAQLNEYRKRVHGATRR